MFNIYIKDSEFREPDDEIYYLLAANGLFQIKKTKFFTASSLIFESKNGKKLHWLEEHTKQIKVHLPKKISETLIKQLISFFLKVYNEYSGAEAIGIIYWDETKEEYSIVIPEQIVGRSALPYYEVGKNPSGLIRCGTIHSHGSLQAFHSEVDHKDEKFDDGIHITIGNIDLFPSFSCSIVCDGERTLLMAQDVIELKDDKCFPEEWLKKVKKVQPIKVKAKKDVWDGVSIKKHLDDWPESALSPIKSYDNSRFVRPTSPEQNEKSEKEKARARGWELKL